MFDHQSSGVAFIAFKRRAEATEGWGGGVSESKAYLFSIHLLNYG
jgi:hypothetical protein